MRQLLSFHHISAIRLSSSVSSAFTMIQLPQLTHSLPTPDPQSASPAEDVLSLFGARRLLPQVSWSINGI